MIERLNKLRDVLESEVGGLDATAYAQQREGLDEAIRILQEMATVIAPALGWQPRHLRTESRV